jgi:hypothetical protein
MDRHGFLELALEQHDDAPPSATALVTEHRPLGARQHHASLALDKPTTLALAEGTYTVAVAAPGYDPSRLLVEVRHSQPQSVSVRLTKRTKPIPTFAERLKRFQLDLAQLHLRDLVVARETRVRLDPTSEQVRSDMHQVTLRTPGDVKTALGSDDTQWVETAPRFGPVFGQAPRTPLGERLTVDARAALHEFVYGNSRSLSSEWTSAISRFIESDPISIYVFPYNVVTVDAGATLEVGPVGLCCDVLRVHATGTIEVTGSGPTVIQTGSYEGFS